MFIKGFSLNIPGTWILWMLVCAVGYASEAVHRKLMLSLICLSLVLFSYKTFLSEDAGPETLVAIVHAKDPDGDGVTYAITGGNEDSNFELDNQKGELQQINRNKHSCLQTLRTEIQKWVAVVTWSRQDFVSS